MTEPVSIVHHVERGLLLAGATVCPGCAPGRRDVALYGER